jgi:solute carrier family 15 (oligopeptide transporter), member 1
VSDPVANSVENPPIEKRSFLSMLGQHPKGFWFIFWGEFAERCSYYGMRAILATYLADKIGLSPDQSSQWMALFMAACYILPMFGGYLADNVLGRYWSIVGFSIPYIAGHFILGYEDKTFVIFALCLLAMGTGVTKPNISSLMGMTYDQKRPNDELLRSSGFAMFYMAINIGAFISQFSMPIIKRNYSYQAAFAFPTILMAIALFFFAIGKKHYAVEKIERRKLTKEDWIERWRVVKLVGGMFLLCSCFWAIFDQSASTWIFFGRDYMTNVNVFGLDVDAEQMQSLNSLLIVIFLPLVTMIWIALANRGIKVRPTDKMMLGFFLTAASMAVMGFAATLAAPGKPVLAKRVEVEKVNESTGKVVKKTVYEVVVELPEDGKLTPELEKKKSDEKLTKLQFLKEEEKVSLTWQALAYFFVTLAEILISVTGLELAFVAAPQSMKSFISAIWLLSVGIGNLAINAPVTSLYSDMSPVTYFFALSGMMVVVMFIFFFNARWFNRVSKTVSAS